MYLDYLEERLCRRNSVIGKKYVFETLITVGNVSRGFRYNYHILYKPHLAS